MAMDLAVALYGLAGGLLFGGQDDAAAQAARIAGNDLKTEWAALCPQPPRPGPPLPGNWHDRTFTPVAPTRVFDNLFYVGHSGVGATALRTSDGIILIDTMTTDNEVATILLPGLKALGLDPADIRIVIVTHGHGDHHGGVQALRRAYPDIRVVMSERDWAYSAKPFFFRDGTRAPAPAPVRQPQDIGFSGETAVTLGDVTVDLIETPGHTDGTISLLYPVRVAGERRWVTQWGGGSPANPKASDSAVRGFTDRARARGATVRWSSHAQATDMPRLAQLRAGAGANPYLYTPGQASRYLDLIHACRRAREAAGRD